MSIKNQLTKIIIVLISVCSYSTVLAQNDIKFLEPEIGLENYEEDKLVKDVDFYISYMMGAMIGEEQNNFNALDNKVDSLISDHNQTVTESSNSYSKHRAKNSATYAVGADIQAFYKLVGIGFNYTRYGYLTQEVGLIQNTTDDPNHYDHTKSYKLNAYGNSYHISALYRAAIGPRRDYNVYVVLGIGYSYFDAVMELEFRDKINNTTTSESFNASAHGFHALFEITTKLKWFNFTLGTKFQTGTLDGYGKSSDLVETVPFNIDLAKLNPFIYAKVGFNF